jgi:hypothetical protein
VVNGVGAGGPFEAPAPGDADVAEGQALASSGSCRLSLLIFTYSSRITGSTLQGLDELVIGNRRRTTAPAGAGSLHPVTTAIASRFHRGQLDSTRKQDTSWLLRRPAPQRR